VLSGNFAAGGDVTLRMKPRASPSHTASILLWDPDSGLR
jgi:hypothetical protein